MAQLHKPNRAVHILHPPVEAEVFVDVALLLAMATDDPAEPRHFVVVGGDDPALAGGHVLGRVKAEAARTEGADAAALVLGAVRLGSVLHQRQLIVFADLGDLRHPRGVPEDVDRHHGLCVVGDGRFQLVRVHVQVERVDVHEHWRGAAGDDAGGCRDEAEGRGDHLIARANAVRLQRYDQRRGAAVHADRVLRPDVFGERLFERLRARTLRQLAAIQHLHHRALLFLAD